MRTAILTALFFSAKLALATSDLEHRHAHLFRRASADICTDNGYVDCYDQCAPPTAVCCSDGSGTYCKAGYTCVPNGCCPVGKTCIGGGGTSTHTDLFTGTSTKPGATQSTSTRKTTTNLISFSTDDSTDTTTLGGGSTGTAPTSTAPTTTSDTTTSTTARTANLNPTNTQTLALASGAAVAGWSRQVELPMALLMVGQLVL